MKILIVEDEPLVADLLRDLIEVDGIHRVTGIANDLSSAMRALDQDRPDLVLVDLQLAGGTTGFEVAGELRARGIPCFFTTATPPPFDIPELAIGCLEKPYCIETVSICLRRAEDSIKRG